MKNGYSAICRTARGGITIVSLGAHGDLVKARKHAEETIGGADDLKPLAIVPEADAAKTARRWRDKFPPPS